MSSRPLWHARVEAAWKVRPIAWLAGLRRTGKTTLAQQLPDVRYENCDLPSVQRAFADPELAFQAMSPGTRLVLDEVHRLPDPTLALKIAADALPTLRVLATGSSTLTASARFRDTLTDRKRTLFFPPVLWIECRADFGIGALDRRLLHGGFPSQLLAPSADPEFFEEWQDSYFARDVQALFGLRNRVAFLRLLGLVALRSGGLLDITDLAKAAGVARPTVMAHLDALEASHAICRLSPFHGGGEREIVKAPKLYAFDTGFICHHRGWSSLRDTDRGHLWEHLVLDHLRVFVPNTRLHFWRDKSQREVDFVIDRRGGVVDSIEAKMSPDDLSSANLTEFRRLYPLGRDYVVCPHVMTPFEKRLGDRVVRVTGLEALQGEQLAHGGPIAGVC